MRKTTTIGAVALVAIAATATIAFVLKSPPSTASAGPAAAATPTASELEVMEAQAADACRCARKLKPDDPSREACWSTFKQNISGYPHSELHAACLPLSSSSICFGEDDQSCIVSDHGGGACTAEEAQVLEAVFARSFRPGDEKSFDLATKRMNEAVQGFIRGERIAIAPISDSTCSG